MRDQIMDDCRQLTHKLSIVIQVVFMLYNPSHIMEEQIQ